MLIKTDVQQLPDGYLDRTPMFQYILLSICFPMWGIAASLNDILITQFKSIFTLSDFASAAVCCSSRPHTWRPIPSFSSRCLPLPWDFLSWKRPAILIRR